MSNADRPAICQRPPLLLRLSIMIFLLSMIQMRFPAPASAVGPVRLGVTPWTSPEKLREMYQPILVHLSRKLNREVVLTVAEDYRDLGARLAAGRLEFAMFSPAAYVRTKAGFQKIRYVASGRRCGGGGDSDHYYAVVIGLKNGGPRTLADLKGKSVGFTDPDSASGCLFAVMALRRNGLDPYRECTVYYLKKHDQTIQALLHGSVSAVATWDGMLAEAVAAHGDIFRVLVRTAPIPNDALAASPYVSEELLDRLRKTLPELTPDSPPMREAAKAGFDLCGFSFRDDSFYAPVRDAYSGRLQP